MFVSLSVHAAAPCLPSELARLDFEHLASLLENAVELEDLYAMDSNAVPIVFRLRHDAAGGTRQAALCQTLRARLHDQMLFDRNRYRPAISEHALPAQVLPPKGKVRRSRFSTLAHGQAQAQAQAQALGGGDASASAKLNERLHQLLSLSSAAAEVHHVPSSLVTWYHVGAAAAAGTDQRLELPVARRRQYRGAPGAEMVHVMRDVVRDVKVAIVRAKGGGCPLRPPAHRRAAAMLTGIHVSSACASHANEPLTGANADGARQSWALPTAQLAQHLRHANPNTPIYGRDHALDMVRGQRLRRCQCCTVQSRAACQPSARAWACALYGCGWRQWERQNVAT
jgi:hypothetical protein